MSYPMLDSDLNALKTIPEFQGESFGVSRVQRYMRIGYSRASQLVEAAVDKGILVRDINSEWLVKLNHHANE